MGLFLFGAARSPGGVGMLSIPVPDCVLEPVLEWEKHAYSYYHN